MKRMIVSMLMTSLMAGLAACTNTSAADAPAGSNSTIELFDVNIQVNADQADTNGMPLILTPQLTGRNDKELQYHWTMAIEDGMEGLVGFAIPEDGPQKNITNTGEPVEFGLFAQIMWVTGATTEMIVQVEVTEMGSSDILATDEITIVGNEGMYSLK